MPDDIDTTQTPPPAVEGANGDPEWDFQRGMAQIKKGRRFERENRALKTAMKAILSGKDVDASALLGGEPDATAGSTELDSYKTAFKDLAAALGTEWTGDPASILSAAKAARVSGELAIVIAAKGADQALTRAVIDLKSIDPSSPNLADDLSELVGHAILDHPQLKRPTTATVSGAQSFSGAPGMKAMVTREQLQFMIPEQIVAAQKSGALEHLNVGSRG